MRQPLNETALPVMLSYFKNSKKLLIYLFATHNSHTKSCVVCSGEVHFYWYPQITREHTDDDINNICTHIYRIKNLVKTDHYSCREITQAQLKFREGMKRSHKMYPHKIYPKLIDMMANLRRRNYSRNYIHKKTCNM